VVFAIFLFPRDSLQGRLQPKTLGLTTLRGRGRGTLARSSGLPLLRITFAWLDHFFEFGLGGLTLRGGGPHARAKRRPPHPQEKVYVGLFFFVMLGESCLGASFVPGPRSGSL